jgi:hypothetical protein
MLIFVNDSVVLFASDLAWPAVVAVIALVLLTTQRRPIGRLIERINSVKYPGGELGTALPESGPETIKDLLNSLSRDMSEPTGQPEPIPARAPAGGNALLQNREPLGPIEPLPIEEVSNLVDLSANVMNMLSELAYPPPPGGPGSVTENIGTLILRGVLDNDQGQKLMAVVDLADRAALGAEISPRLATSVKNAGLPILDQFNKLRIVAARRFEDHVLSVLRRNMPGDWYVDIDRTIMTSDGGNGTGMPVGEHRVKVDALVTAGDRQAVVEVRARLQPGATDYIEEVRELVAALPEDLPVLLVMLGERLAAHELQQIRGSRGAAVELLEWDRYPNALIPMLRDILRSQAPRPAEFRA